MHENRITTVLFDVGRIIVQVDTEGMLLEIAQQTGKDRDELERAILDPDFLYRYETGRMSQKEAREHLNATVGMNLGPVEFYTSFLRHVPEALEMEGIHSLVRRLKLAGYRTLALTNIAPLTLTYLNRHSATLQLLDEVYASCELECMKPDPEIYKEVLQAEEKPAEAIIFIDDREENIDAAKALGFHVILGGFGTDPIEKSLWEAGLRF